MHDLYSWTMKQTVSVSFVKKKKKKMLNACFVLFSRNGVYTQSFIHMLTFFHTHMFLVSVIISVLNNKVILK